MNNKFFTYSDPSIDKLIFPLEPNFWWSRRYEYAACIDEIKDTDVVLDSCCGLEHPFKFALSDKCKQVYACDLENLSQDNILQSIKNRFGKEELDKFDKSYFDKINLQQANITSLPYSDKMFSKIFIISALEHCDKETVLSGLKEFKRVLKNTGRIYITLDYPTMIPDKFIDLVNQSGLQISGEYDYSIPENAITSDYFGGQLYCYSMVLKK